MQKLRLSLGEVFGIVARGIQKNMKRVLVLLLGLFLIAAGGISFLFRDRFVGTHAGLLIESVPSATVYIDGEQAGTTPYQIERTPGEVSLRLVPIATDGPLAPWDTRVVLAEGIRTVVRREFETEDEESRGEIMSFEKIPAHTAELVVVSVPDATTLLIDGTNKGFTPKKVENVGVGEHRLVFSHPGFLDREILVKAEAGYKLVVTSFLGRDKDFVGEGKDKEVLLMEEKTMVGIKDTPTGFLRVREKAATSSPEVAQVKPGKSFELIEESSDGGWFKIRYEKDKEGWVSSTYSKKIEKKKE